MVEPGVLLIDKSTGPTSHDVVARVRRRVGERRCGHTGTLDPFATGLLFVCIGRATRLARFLTDVSKTYDATIHFGYATDTYDRTGRPAGAVRSFEPEESALERAVDAFHGVQLQTPPPFSAKKIDGTRAYELARRGETVTATPVEVEVHTIALEQLQGAEARIRVSVSAGTYIRSIAHDLGQRLGCGAHLKELRRTHVGSFAVSEALPLASLETVPTLPTLTPRDALRDLPEIAVDRLAAERLVHGRAPRLSDVPATTGMGTTVLVRIVGPDGGLLAVGEPDLERRIIRPVVVWGRPESGERVSGGETP